MRVIQGENLPYFGNLGLQISNPLLVSSVSSSVRMGIICSLLAYFESTSVHSASVFSLLDLFASSVDTASIYLSLFDFLASSSKGGASTSI